MILVYSCIKENTLLRKLLVVFAQNNLDLHWKSAVKWSLYFLNYTFYYLCYIIINVYTDESSYQLLFYTLRAIISYYLFNIFSHNDLPWNIRKFIHNKLNTVNFSTVLSTINPWSESQWSHTDLYRLNKGHVGGQVIKYADFNICFHTNNWILVRMISIVC